MTQASLGAAVQAQPAPAVRVNDPGPPSAVKSRCCGETSNVHCGGTGGCGGPGGGGGFGAGGSGGRVVCVKSRLCPATTTAAVRSPSGFGANVSWTVAAPDPDEGAMVIQEASVAAVQLQAEWVATLTGSCPPSGPMDSAGRDTL